MSGAPAGSMSMSLPAFDAMWTVMVAAMMLPAVAPVAIRYRRMIDTGGTGLGLFTAGYVGVWATSGAVAYPLTVAVATAATASRAVAMGGAAALFLLYGLYQLTPLKARCLRVCHAPFGVLLRYASWRGPLRHLRVGAHHGLYCLGCCWALMLLMFAGGVMNGAAMALLALVVTAEKVWPHGLLIPRLVGVVCCALAVAVLWIPALAPGLLGAPAPMLR